MVAILQYIIDYFKKKYANHSHLVIVERVLRCLAYIEANIDKIAAQAGKHELLRDPQSGMAFHVVGFATPEIARNSLLNFVNEVRAAFHVVMKIENERLRQEVGSAFLNNISDNAAGCMEARVRPALEFIVLYKEKGCIDLHNLMRDFAREYPQQTLKDMLDGFSHRVEHALPVFDETGKIVPLTWEKIKDYCSKVLLLDDIEAYWLEEGSKLTQPKFVQSTEGYYCNFKNETDAARLLTYIKSLLPKQRAELAKAKLKYNKKHKSYSFWLSAEQYREYNQLLEKANRKDKEECATFDATVLYRERNLDHLTDEKVQSLRKEIRAGAKKLTVKGDYIIKTLRADELYFARQFIETIAPPNIKHPLRRGYKFVYTVTGAGVFQHRGLQRREDVPMKKPQYTKKEKQGFSKTQSASLGWDGYDPKAFGFSTRGDKLVGVLIESQNVLLTDRLFLYDNGTLYRPYYYGDGEQAKTYSKDKCNVSLFSRGKVNDFKAAVIANGRDKYNEAMVRLRWGTDGTSKLIIASDTLSSRILIQENARLKKKYFVDQGLMDARSTLPICYFVPDNPNLHLKEYTEDEQQLDRLYVLKQYQDDRKKFIESIEKKKQYELLLALPPACIKEVFQHEGKKKINIMLTLMADGYIHIITSIFEKMPEEKEELLKLLLNKMQQEKYDHLFWAIFYHCVRTKSAELIQRLLAEVPIARLSKTTGCTVAQFVTAAELGYEQFIQVAVQYGVTTEIINKLHKGESAILVASREGHEGIVSLLLAHKQIYLGERNKNTPLMLAAARGYIGIVKAILPFKDIAVESVDSLGDSAITIAAWNGHTDIVKLLLKYNDSLRYRKANKGYSLLHIAAICKDIALCKELLLYPGPHHTKNSLGNTPLHYAAATGFIEMVKAMRDIGVGNVDAFNNDLQTALMIAAANNQTEVLKLLLAEPLVQVNMSHNEGITALMWAVKKGHIESVKVLLQHKSININQICRDRLGEWTALRYAIVYRQYDIMRLLLADPRTRIQNEDYIDWLSHVRTRTFDFDKFQDFFMHPTFNIKTRLPYGKSILAELIAHGETRAFEKILSNPSLTIDLLEDKGVYQDFIKASQHADFANILRDYLLECYLPGYIERREGQENYKHWYGVFFGENKKVKIAAANALMNEDDLTHHRAAFETGELKRVCTLLLHCDKAVKISAIQFVI